MDKALAHLKSAFPFTTPEWSAWSATMRTPRIEGTWAVSGYEPGEGPFFGRVTITPNAASGTGRIHDRDQLHLRANAAARSTRTGRALIYTGFQWRGRTTVGRRRRHVASAKS